MKNRKGSSPAGLKPPGDDTIVGSKVRLRSKKLTDVRNDYEWQSDPELSRLDAAPVLNTPFPVYLLDYSEEIHRTKATKYPLAVDTLDGRHIGNCTCYDINEDKGEAQIGIMIGDRAYWDKGFGSDAISTMVNHVFSTTKLRRIYLKTLEWNARAQKCFEKCGFTPCGELKRNDNNFLFMEMTREQWQKRKDGGKTREDG